MDIRPHSSGIVTLQIFTDDSLYIDADFVPRLQVAVDALAQDETIAAVILQGGSDYFSAGGARELLLSEELEASVEAMPRLLLSIPVPTIAAMTGHAIGGGLIAGLWCDMVALAEESLYGANFMQLGITPGMGATTVLEEMVGASLAREMLFSGRFMTGRELKESGCALAHAVVPKRCVLDRALSLATELADVPRHALLVLKERLAARRLARFESAWSEERAMHSRIFSDARAVQEISTRYGVSTQ